jgi:predicted branched-subunit amino acid permease
MTTAVLTAAATPVRRTPTGSRDLARGAAAMSALLLGFAPFGVVVGMAAGASDVPAAAWAGTWLIYSGSAHLAVIGGLTEGDGLLIVVLTGLLVNARLIAFSASLAPTFRSESRRFRLVAAALLVDPLWALVTGGDRSDRSRHYYLGAGLVLWFGWAAAVTTGLLLARQQALADVTAIGAPLCLVALVAPFLRTAAGAACVASAAVVGLSYSALPAGTGVLAGMVAGTLAASAVRRWSA